MNYHKILGGVTTAFSDAEEVVPLHHPRVLVELTMSRGISREAVLEGTGITAAMLSRPEARISYRQFNALERNALRLSNDPGLGLAWGRAIYTSQSGLVGIATLGVADAGAAFQLARMYYEQVAPGWALDLRVAGPRGYFTLRDTIGRGDLLPFATEAMVSGFLSLVEHALGHWIALEEFRFAYPAPAHHELYREYLHDTPLLWDEPVTEAVFDPKVLKQPITGTGAMAAPESAATAAGELSPQGIAARVRKVLLAHGARRMGLEQVARELGTSARSLRRALSQAGTSYQDIAESLLRARAEAWVRAGTDKVEYIARELGFTNARSFRRAFKRWTGRNPNELRRDGDPE